MRFINNLNVLEAGSGPLTLVFLHHFGGSALEWQGVTDRLSKQYRCLAIDLRGHGDSDGSGRLEGQTWPGQAWPGRTETKTVDASATGYTVDDMADDVICVVQEMAVEEFVLIGHSMSGKVALAVAAGTPNQHRPAGLRQLLLVSPSPPLPEPIPDDERAMMLRSYGQREAAEKMLKNTTAVSVSEAVCDQIIADNLRTAKPAWDAWLNAGSREDISARMAAVDLPVHIIVGTEDRALPPDVQHRMVLPYLKGATLETIDGAGHLLPWEVPDEVAAFITKKVGQ